MQLQQIVLLGCFQCSQGIKAMLYTLINTECKILDFGPSHARTPAVVMNYSGPSAGPGPVNIL